MTRPEIIRADSVDLQDPNSPSAQDHTRQPTHPNPLGVGPPAPHQAEALREVAAEAKEQNLRSPRVSREWTNAEAQHIQQQNYGDDLADGVSSSLTSANLQHQDVLAIAQNGGQTGSMAEDADMADGEGEDGMDDDMMDKISSSPSIDDGGYSLPHVRSQQIDSIARSRRASSTQACGESSSPFVETPEYYPLCSSFDASDSPGRYHLPGEYLEDLEDKDESTCSGHDLESSSLLITTAPVSYVECDDEYQDFDKSDILEPHLAEVPEPDSILAGDEEEEEDGDDDDELMITYISSDDENDDYDIPFTANTRFVDSGWGGECLQELEDIDFEFVYALHTFVATVEGQANATKGDTMVLLDDSNSYWWLVRVVKDSSIGYLPAEHIETPTERLARLNKHRNIDLTSTMLGDQAEKSKNPLKKAIRRRNAKTVAFAPPTYVEASDIDYTTDEEAGEGDYYGQKEEEGAVQQERVKDEDEIVATEPLKPRAEIREVKPDVAEADLIASSEAPRSSDEVVDGKLENSKSRNGTVRNTDSFFKDDTVETRKITLTPNLLRDDSSTSTRASGDSKEYKQRPSLDKLEKDSATDKKDKKSGKEKKEKDKKPGMLSGLFKRKDKKSKVQEEDIDELVLGKRSAEKDRVSPSPSKDSEDAVADEAPIQDVQRQPSKLQKHPRTELSPNRKAAQSREPTITEVQQAPGPEQSTPAESVQAPSMRLVQPDTGSEETIKPVREPSPERTKAAAPVLSAPKEQKSGGTISKMLSIRSAGAGHSDARPIKVKKAKSRVELDDFDSSDDSPVEEIARGPNKQPSQRPIPGSFPDSYITLPQVETGDATEERLSESPVEVSPVTPPQSYLPPLMVDTSSQEGPPSPVSSPSPELIDAEDAGEKKDSSTTSTSTAAWSDAHLRTFFDDSADIKDLLVVVYDKSGVVPAGPDHPITGNFFREENAKLADITNRLDGMLGDWLARKMRTQGSR